MKNPAERSDFSFTPDSIFIGIEQRQLLYPEMRKLVAFSPHPKEVDLYRGNQCTRKWKNWLPSAILINLLEKRKDN